jgi:hypothetical protein
VPEREVCVLRRERLNRAARTVAAVPIEPGVIPWAGRDLLRRWQELTYPGWLALSWRTCWLALNRCCSSRSATACRASADGLACRPNRASAALARNTLALGPRRESPWAPTRALACADQSARDFVIAVGRHWDCNRAFADPARAE